MLEVFGRRATTFLWIPILATGCGGQEEITTDAGMRGGLIADASAKVVPGGETGSPVLRTTLLLKNTGSEAIELVFLADCPVVVELHRAGADEDDSLVFDGGMEPCTRRGERVRLQPGEQHEFTGLLRLERLRIAGVTAGTYEVVAMLTMDPPRVRVDAGEIMITNLR